MSAAVPDIAWKVCFVIFSIQIFHDALGSSIAFAYWLLGQTGVLLDRPGDAGLELQIIIVPHGQEDLINGDIRSSVMSRTTLIEC